MPVKMRMAQYGTKHGHAEGVLQVMLDHPEVEVVGVCEPDPKRRQQIEHNSDQSWGRVPFVDSPSDFLDDPTVVCVASEGANKESLAFTEDIVAAGKHAFYDKPAGDDYHRFERVVEQGELLAQGRLRVALAVLQQLQVKGPRARRLAQLLLGSPNPLPRLGDRRGEQQQRPQRAVSRDRPDGGEAF